MPYISITEDEVKEKLGVDIVSREQEIAAYDVNIANFEAMVEKLPKGKCPANADDYTKDDYVYRDQLIQRIKQEKIQRRRSARVFEALVSRVGKVKLAEVVASGKAKIKEIEGLAKQATR